jgi:hypothetical protein
MANIRAGVLITAAPSIRSFKNLPRTFDAPAGRGFKNNATTDRINEGITQLANMNNRRQRAIPPREYAAIVAHSGSGKGSVAITANEIRTAERSKKRSITTEMNEEPNEYDDHLERIRGRINSPTRPGRTRLEKLPSIKASNNVRTGTWGPSTGGKR